MNFKQIYENKKFIVGKEKSSDDQPKIEKFSPKRNVI